LLVQDESADGLELSVCSTLVLSAEPEPVEPASTALKMWSIWSRRIVWQSALQNALFRQEWMCVKYRHYIGIQRIDQAKKSAVKRLLRL